jgi:hypothetical protein
MFYNDMGHCYWNAETDNFVYYAKYHNFIMKRILQLSILIFLFSAQAFSQAGFSPQIETAMNNCTMQTLSLMVRQLSGDTSCIVNGNPTTIMSRHYNNTYNTTAEQFIFQKFQSYGYSPAYMSFNTLGKNVYAIKTGTKYPNRRFIICGHFDNMPSGTLAPGADDNASGTCAVLEAARILAPFQFDYTLIFIAFDEEERGLYGSKAYADTAYSHQDSIVGVFNYDMIAWDGNNDFKFDLISNTNSVAFTDLTKSAFNLYQPQIAATRVINNNAQYSDHWYFWQKGWKAFCGIEYSSDFNPYYHTINDKFLNVKMNYFLANTKAAIAALMSFGIDAFMTMNHTPITSTSNTGPLPAALQIISVNPVAKLANAPRLYYKVNNGNYSYLNPTGINGNTYNFTIPGQPVGSTVGYYFAAQDSLGRFVVTYPYGGKGLTPPGTTPPTNVLTYNILTGLEPVHNPALFTLDQNYPNPFNPVTNIKFNLAKSSHARLVVTDMLGKFVAELVNGNLPYGENIVRFNAVNLSSGIYLYTLYVNGEKIDTKKMLLAK